MRQGDLKGHSEIQRQSEKSPGLHSSADILFSFSLGSLAVAVLFVQQRMVTESSSFYLVLSELPAVHRFENLRNYGHFLG